MKNKLDIGRHRMIFKMNGNYRIKFVRLLEQKRKIHITILSVLSYVTYDVNKDKIRKCKVRKTIK